MHEKVCHHQNPKPPPTRRVSGRETLRSPWPREPPSAVKPPRVSSQAVISRLGLGYQHGTISPPLCSTCSPETLNQVTKRRLLQPPESLLSVKCSPTGRIPARPFTVWYLSCQTHSLSASRATSTAVDPDQPVFARRPSLTLCEITVSLPRSRLSVVSPWPSARDDRPALPRGLAGLVCLFLDLGTSWLSRPQS